MNCKYCNTELVEGQPFCPGCGKKQDEELTPVEMPGTVQEAEASAAVEVPAENPEGKNPQTGKIALAVVAVVLVLALLVSLVIGGLGGAKDSDAEPTEEVVAVTIPSNGDPASPLCKESYTVSDEEAMENSDVVVATVGDRELTNGELQAFYWQEVYLFMQEYGYYASYIGLDVASPLDLQLTQMGETPMSWQQFFLDSAIYSWHNYQSMALEGEEKGYVMPEDRQAELDSLPADLEESSASGGFESVDDMIKQSIGAACTLDAYLDYVDVYYHGLTYYYDYCDSLNPSEEEVENYYAENEAEYADQGITKDAKFVDVRHVLLQPENGETGADGYPVYTDEAWEACRIKAEEIYANWQEGDLSEDSFAQLAMDNSVDGNAAEGGLYENVYVGQMVEEFENWCFDETRQPGDHGLVKTSYGYHIMFFSDSRPIAYADVRNVLLQPENGETAEDGTTAYTDEAWEACRIKAEELYNQWLEGDKTEESFAQLAIDNSAADNASNGGVNQGLTFGQMDEQFDAWCFDENRGNGDHGLIKTADGYQILLMSELRPAWYYNAKYDLINEIAYNFIPEMMEKYPLFVDYSLITLGDLDLS